MKKTILILTLIAPGLAFGFWGKGKNKGDHKKHKNPAKKVEMLSKKLNLTADQKTKVLAIHQESQATNKELKKNKMKTLREEMQAMLKADASAEALRAKHKEIESVQAQLSDNRFDKMLKIRALLTPEQKEKFVKMRKNFEKKFKKGRKKNK